MPLAVTPNHNLRPHGVCGAQVEVLGSSMMAYFPPALEALMQPGADAQDMCEVIILLNQLIIRFKAALQPLLLKVTPFRIGLKHAL